jgi:membrane protein YdbS with pleckstrin-like domain
MSDGDGRADDGMPDGDDVESPDGSGRVGTTRAAGDADADARRPDDGSDTDPSTGAAAAGEATEAAETEHGSATGASEPLDPAEVDVAELTGPERSLESAVRLVWILRAALAAVVLGAVTGALSVVLDGPAWVGPVVFTVLFLFGTVRAHLRYESWSYRVRANSLFLDRGVFTRVRTVVPYVRIQHVDASRGPVERAFGLATVVVYTAGSRGADVSIPGLTPERADDLQDRLKRLAIAAEGEDAV